MKIQHLFAEKYERMFAERFSKTSKKVECSIYDGKLRATEILEDSRKVEENRLFLERERVAAELKAQNAERELYSKNLLIEIRSRCDNLARKWKIDFPVLDDYQIFDLRKESVNNVNEVNLILEKITSFSKHALYCDDVMEELCKLRDETTNGLALFTKKLDQIIRERDLSEEKLKRAFELKINIPKFKGYGSEVDIYTFRAKFEKLVEPVLQRKLWVDYLKRNYLSGTALTLVEEIEDIDKVWEKLTEFFGSTRLLLQSKIASLEGISDLWRITGDEKISHALALLINVMGELSALANRFNLEEELYYGGCLEKIISLLGNTRERTFVCSSNSQLRKPQEWERLRKFLNEELLEREKMILYEKSKKCFGIDKASSSIPKKTTPKQVYQSSDGSRSPKCFFCGQFNHVACDNGK